MLNKVEISFSSIIDSSSLESFIIDTFNISKSKLKKSKMNKKYLAKAVRAKDELSLDINLINSGLIQLANNYQTDKVIFENDNFIAVDKNYKEHSYPLTYNEVNNVLSNLFYYRQNLRFINQESMDRGLLFRLDFETSGLLLYAKNNEYYQKIRSNFSQLVGRKEYIAMVKGKLDQDIDLDHYLKPSSAKGMKMVICDDATDMHANLSVKAIEYNSEEDYSLVKVILKQGHRHQIRVQLAHVGYPIIGDDLYGKHKEQRLYLHCYKYVIEGVEVVDTNLELFNLFFDFDSEL